MKKVEPLATGAEQFSGLKWRPAISMKPSATNLHLN